jgi:hypothetical protein
LPILVDTGFDMEENKSFNDLLFQAILERQQMFDSFLLPKMHEEFLIVQSAVKSIRSILVKKAILHDDPYKYDSKTNDLQIPPDENYSDNERSAIIGQRLAQYEAMTDFLCNYWLFSCDFLTTERITKLVAFNRSFTWEAFSNTSNKPNTRGLADLVNTIRNGSDPLSISIINDALMQLSKSSLAITKTLKNLTDFHRERYKTAVRKLVLPNVVIDTATLESGTSAAMREIKRAFASGMSGQPFYTELIEEILQEEYAPDHVVRQQELLARLSSVKQEAGKTAAGENHKATLLEGIRILGATSQHIEAMATKLVENHIAAENTEKTFFQKFIKAIKKSFGISEKEEEIIITSVDPVTQTGKKDTINFTPYIEELRRRARIYTGFSMRSSAAYQKIELMEEQQILDLLTRHLAEMNTVLKQCTGLDNYFKQIPEPEVKERIHGIKVELSGIKNNLVKANQCRAEYAAQIEEQQQLKKLGIINA